MGSRPFGGGFFASGNESAIYVMSDEWTQDDGFTPDGFSSAAGFSTIAYSGGTHARKGFCAARNHTCKGRRTKTSIYCAGHERAILGAKKDDS